MAKLRVQDLARSMGISHQDLISKLKSIGVLIEGNDLQVDESDIIQAILQGKRLPHPRELRDEQPPPGTARRRTRASRRPLKLIHSVEPGYQDEAVVVAGERSEILARKHSDGTLSTAEQERLDSLTARLRELLPPVSVGELEVLLTMTEEADRIRNRARERRQRLA